MNSRERVKLALEHKETDKIPVDFGSCGVTGIHVSALYQIRQALGLDKPGTPVRVVDPLQMLGEVTYDLVKALELDAVRLGKVSTPYGFRNENFKEWKFWDGTPLLVAEKFNTDPNPDGGIYQYPGGDKSLGPSAHMPRQGYYFDPIIRQEPFEEDKLDPKDNVEEYGSVSDTDLVLIKTNVEKLYAETDRALVASFGGTDLGNVAHITAPALKKPKGIRDITEWYVSLVARPDHIKKIFDMQIEIALPNLKKIHKTIGDKVSVVLISGADYGTQKGPIVSPETFANLFKPYYKRVNDWIHENTEWKIMFHSCGGIVPLLDHFYEMGVDILNPVQTSATGMDPVMLKEKYGKKFTFWGGGIDTQKVLPFGTPEEVKKQVKERFRIFSPGGGFVFNSIHNIQAGIPVKNILAMFEAIKEARQR